MKRAIEIALEYADQCASMMTDQRSLAAIEELREVAAATEVMAKIRSTSKLERARESAYAAWRDCVNSPEVTARQESAAEVAWLCCFSDVEKQLQIIALTASWVTRNPA